MFPLPVEALNDRRILFIGVDAAHPHCAYFVVGVAQWTGSELRVAYSPNAPSAVPNGTPSAWSGFDPAILPNVLMPDAWRHVEPLGRDVEACVVAWVSQPLAEALALPDPFFGLAASGHTGGVLLMQGDPSMMDPPADTFL
jgi:hypothetical protein